jgi:hypothetical protein
MSGVKATGASPAPANPQSFVDPAGRPKKQP